MGVPYETKPVHVSVGGGETATVRVTFPSRSFIHKIAVVQTVGGQESFDVDLYGHADALEGTQVSSSTVDGHQIPLDCYRVGSRKTGQNGALLYFSDEATGGVGLPFFCHDLRSDRQGQILQNLYVRISPGGAGPKEFFVCVGGEAAVG